MPVSKITTSSIDALGYGFKNRILNGSMVIDQRNAGASVTYPGGGSVGSNLYVLDRYVCNSTGSTRFSVQRSITAPGGFANSMLVTTTTSGSPGASDACYIGQYVEGFNTADFGFGTASAQPVALSFWVRSSLTGLFGGTLANSDFTRRYAWSFTINAANTWEYKTVTIPGDTSGTWNTGNDRGFSLLFNLGSGSSTKGTGGVWGSSVTYPTGSIDLVATAGATLSITGLQLEKGNVATSFDYRPYGTELQLCQRYYAKTFPQGTAPAQNAGVGGALGGQDSGSGAYGFQLQWRFPVTMRASPTVVSFNPSAANSNIRNTALNTDCTTVASNITTSDSQTSLVGVSSTPTAGTNVAVHFTASAEL